MALTLPSAVEIQISPTSTTSSIVPVVFYDTAADELIFKFDELPRTLFVFPVNDTVSLLCDDASGETVGIQIDTFATHAVHAFPALTIIAKVLGIVPREPDDTLLFREGRTVMRENAFSRDDEREFKHVIRHIIDYTGGFDPGIVNDGPHVE